MPPKLSFVKWIKNNSDGEVLQHSEKCIQSLVKWFGTWVVILLTNQNYLIMVTMIPIFKPTCYRLLVVKHLSRSRWNLQYFMHCFEANLNKIKKNKIKCCYYYFLYLYSIFNALQSSTNDINIKQTNTIIIVVFIIFCLHSIFHKMHFKVQHINNKQKTDNNICLEIKGDQKEDKIDYNG